MTDPLDYFLVYQVIFVWFLRVAFFVPFVSVVLIV
jgi:hypothetical protein